MCMLDELRTCHSSQISSHMQLAVIYCSQAYLTHPRQAVLILDKLCVACHALECISCEVLDGPTQSCLAAPRQAVCGCHAQK